MVFANSCSEIPYGSIVGGAQTAVGAEGVVSGVTESFRFLGECDSLRLLRSPVQTSEEFVGCSSSSSAHTLFPSLSDFS